MDKLYTARQAGDMLGITSSSIRYIARARKLGSMLGIQRVFTQSEIDQMKDRKQPGKPLSVPIIGGILEIVEKLELDGKIKDVNDVKVLVRPRPFHQVVCKIKNESGKTLYVVKA